MIVKPRNIKQNYLLNVIRLTLNIAVIVGTMPYVNRILGSEGIGKVEYCYAILEYFLIFSALGIPIYGVREVARYRDDVKERSRITIELLCIIAITTLIAYCCFFALIAIAGYGPRLQEILIILGFGILLSNFSLEWFYQGIENQLFITIRHVFVKVVALIYLFCAVKSDQDTTHYAMFLLISMFGGSIFNILYIRKFVLFDKTILKNLNLRRHIKPSLTILMAGAAVSIYMQLDKIMLRNMVSDSAVGYYSQAVKLPRQAILIITTLGAVMLPRLSHHYHNNNKAGYYNYLNRALGFICLIAVPLFVIFLMLAHPIILVMAGKGFIPSIAVLKLSAPLILIVSIAYFVGFMVLYPAGLEKIYTYAVGAAALVNFVFNLVAIPAFKQNGAAIGTLIAEITGLVILIAASRKLLLQAGFFNPDKLKYLAAGAIMAGAIYIMSFCNILPLLNIILAAIVGMAVYIISLFLLKDHLTIEIYSIAIRVINKTSHTIQDKFNNN